MIQLYHPHHHRWVHNRAHNPIRLTYGKRYVQRLIRMISSIYIYQYLTFIFDAWAFYSATSRSDHIRAQWLRMKAPKSFDNNFRNLFALNSFTLSMFNVRGHNNDKPQIQSIFENNNLAAERIKGSRELAEGIWFNQGGKSIFKLRNHIGRRTNTWIGKSYSNGKLNCFQPSCSKTSSRCHLARTSLSMYAVWSRAQWLWRRSFCQQ